ncbi:hypothetical protein HKBW3S06_00990, partial [Candidatus Hakubella thermalkaliphila]
MAYWEIKTDEKVRELHQRGDGYIYNDYGTKWGRPHQWNVLHEAACGYVGRMNIKTPKWYFDSYAGVTSWLKQNRGHIGYKECPCVTERPLIQDSDVVDKLSLARSMKTESARLRISPNEISDLDKLSSDIAKHLLAVYINEKVPRYVAHFDEAGFSRINLESDPNKFFQFILLAIYDRQPFSRITRGWEPIWGIKFINESLPRRLMEAGLFDYQQVSKMD